MKKFKSIDLFAGIGGIRSGFESAGFETVYANDFDHKAADTYRMNFGEIDETNLIDVIRSKKMAPIPKKFDILLAGFPCQPFSLAGNMKGFEDKGRGDLLFAIIEILKERKPRAVFLENVKNLQHHDGGRTFERIEKELKDAGYLIEAKVMNSMHYGNVPQTRERIYIIGFRNPNRMKKFSWPREIALSAKMSDILEEKIPDKYYYSPADECIYPKLKESVRKKNIFYQYRRVYVRENKNGVCPTLTASMGLGGHNVPIIKDSKGIRKLTPRECIRLQGFRESFMLPLDQADSSLYKQAGNSVTVPVISRIAEKVRIALES